MTNHPIPDHVGCSARWWASCEMTTTKTRSKKSSRKVTRLSLGRSSYRAGGRQRRRNVDVLVTDAILLMRLIATRMFHTEPREVRTASHRPSCTARKRYFGCY